VIARDSRPQPDRVAIAGTVLLPGGQLVSAIVEVEAGRIVEVRVDPPPSQVRALRAAGPRTLRLARDEVLAPAFVDAHCHGAGGGDVLGGSLATMAGTLLRHGVGAVVATVSTAPIDTLMAAARGLAEGHSSAERATTAAAASATAATAPATAAAGAAALPAAEVLGLHLEGPALAPERSAGHDVAAFTVPTALSASLASGEAGWQRVRMVTLAPELEGGLELVAQLAGAGIVASIGHSDASLDVALAAYGAGARSATHLLNGMPPLRPREPGLVGAALAAAPFVELISDGIHVDAALLGPLARAIGDERLLIVSDALPLAGSRLRRVSTPGSSARIVGDRALHPDGTLAGSRLLLDGMLAGAVRHGIPLALALRAMTENPARLLGLPDRGLLAPGQRADLVVVTRAGQLRRVLAGGQRAA
jgi:N-acetylglucosamine-6-phosphate deacetylase